MTDALEQPQENPKEWKAVYIGCNDWDLDGPRTKEEWELAARAPQLQTEFDEARKAICKLREAQQDRKQLTDEAISELWLDTCIKLNGAGWISIGKNFARAIEAAHGIKGE